VPNDRIATAIAIVITIVWTLSLVLDAVWAKYDPPGTVHALMMAVAGWAFGQRYLTRRSAPEDPKEKE
jgi:hypothetical protein